MCFVLFIMAIFLNFLSFEISSLIQCIVLFGLAFFTNTILILQIFYLTKSKLQYVLKYCNIFYENKFKFISSSIFIMMKNRWWSITFLKRSEKRGCEFNERTRQFEKFNRRTSFIFLYFSYPKNKTMQQVIEYFFSPFWFCFGWKFQVSNVSRHSYFTSYILIPIAIHRCSIGKWPLDKQCWVSWKAHWVPSLSK